MSRGASVRVLDAPVQVRLVEETTALDGEPMPATTMGPKGWRGVRWPKTWANLGAVKVTTALAGKASGAVWAVESASQPVGRSTARMGATQAGAVRRSRRAAARPRRG